MTSCIPNQKWIEWSHVDEMIEGGMNFMTWEWMCEFIFSWPLVTHRQTTPPKPSPLSLPCFLQKRRAKAGPTHNEVKERFTSLSIGPDSCLSEESETERRRDDRWKHGWDGGLPWARSRYYGDFTAAWRRRRLLRLSDTDAHIKVFSPECERQKAEKKGRERAIDGKQDRFGLCYDSDGE